MISVAVLLTCHNRRERTLACLKAVHASQRCSPFTTKVYLVDDDSTDGTAEAVRERFADTRVLHGDGNLFWNGGMRLAFEEAQMNDPDYFLWLNDDTRLYSTALDTLLFTAFRIAECHGDRFIVVGSIQDPETMHHTYGGMVRSSRWHPLRFKPCLPADTPQQCLTMHGNCVLVPRTTARIVGNLSEAFTHGMGDIDYGLRASRLGCTIWVAPGYLGTCPRNPVRGTWLDPSLPLKARIGKMRGPKGVPPAEFLTFARRHAGPLWPLYWLLPYRRLFPRFTKDRT